MLSQVLLNGNKSYDDKGVVTWEWTKEKGGEGVELPADIAGARSPFLTVSNMVEGKYDFLLKVTDEAGQSDPYGAGVYILKVRKYVQSPSSLHWITARNLSL